MSRLPFSVAGTFFSGYEKICSEHSSQLTACSPTLCACAVFTKRLCRESVRALKNDENDDVCAGRPQDLSPARIPSAHGVPFARKCARVRVSCDDGPDAEKKSPYTPSRWEASLLSELTRGTHASQRDGAGDSGVFLRANLGFLEKFIAAASCDAQFIFSSSSRKRGRYFAFFVLLSCTISSSCTS